MSDINTITLSGRLTKDPEIGEGFTKFSIAQDRWNGKESVTQYFNCIIFGKRCNFVNEYCKKGDKVLISGEVENKQYNEKYYTTVKVMNLVK